MTATVKVEPRGELTRAPSIAFEHQCRLAEAFAASGLFGIKTADQALSLMALCEAEGMHPAKAIQEYHIINGKPALKADAMMARFQAAGGRVKWIDMTDERVAGEFSHPAGGTVTIDWDKARATTAGFWGKDNWKKFPRAMLRARTISEGIRTVFPGAVVGVYTPEEVQDFEPPKAAQASIEPKSEAKPAELQPYPESDLASNLSAWNKLIDEGKQTAGAIIGRIETRFTLTDEQKKIIYSLEAGQ